MSSKNRDDGPDKRSDERDSPDDSRAVKNQSVVTPDDYPDSDGGKPDYRRKDRD